MASEKKKGNIGNYINTVSACDQLLRLFLIILQQLHDVTSNFQQLFNALP
jgi:hypothetical protein